MIECCLNIKEAERCAAKDGVCNICPHKDNPDMMTIRELLIAILKELRKQRSRNA
jgi:hypothetical protein